MRRDMTRLRQQGKLNAAQMTYASPTRPVEEFYDTQSDPHQVKNLAGSPEHQTRLAQFRKRQQDGVRHSRDLGFLPEADAWRRIDGGTPWELARDEQRYPLARILSAANRVGDPAAAESQVQRLTDDDPAVRYWAVIGLHSAKDVGTAATAALHRAREDVSTPVVIEAAAALAARGDGNSALGALVAALDDEQAENVLHAMRSLQLMGSDAQPARPAIEAALRRAKAQEASSTQPLWMFVRFSAEAALAELR
jgi:uncharacterized sulfatase